MEKRTTFYCRYCPRIRQYQQDIFAHRTGYFWPWITNPVKGFIFFLENFHWGMFVRVGQYLEKVFENLESKCKSKYLKKSLLKYLK